MFTYIDLYLTEKQPVVQRNYGSQCMFYWGMFIDHEVGQINTNENTENRKTQRHGI